MRAIALKVRQARSLDVECQKIMMKGWFARNRTGIQRLCLFAAAVIVAIALARGLNSSEYGVSPAIEPSDASMQTLVAESFDPGELTVEDRYDRQWIHYATVSRSDGSFRQMFISPEDARRVVSGQPLPEDTLIIMETWYSPESPGTVFIKQKRDGQWLYGSFSPSRPDYRVSDRGSCHRCHAPFPEMDFTLTKPLLEAALQRGALQQAYCDRAGRTPCPLASYLPEAS